MSATWPPTPLPTSEQRWTQRSLTFYDNHMDDSTARCIHVMTPHLGATGTQIISRRAETDVRRGQEQRRIGMLAEDLFSRLSSYHNIILTSYARYPHP
jgi:hypothetical protein